MNILIIGGQGFVGQYLSNELSKNPANTITILSRKRNTDQYIDTNSFSNIRTITGFDILDYKSISKHFYSQDIVFNLAGLVSFKQKDREMLNKVNHTGVLNVLKACEESGVNKLIHLSSTAALGFSDECIDESHMFDWSKHKKCVYSISKSLANNVLKESKCDTIIVYPSLILGPGDKTNTLQLINAIKNKKIPFNTPGRNSVVDVRDLARALVFLMNSDGKQKEFIVSGGSYSFKEINQKIAAQLNTTPPRITSPRIMLHPLLLAVNAIEKYSNNPPITHENVFLSFKDREHDNSRLKKLGFNFEYTLDKTIEDSIKWSIMLEQ